MAQEALERGRRSKGSCVGRIEALALTALRPKGVGAYSTAVLEYEMKGWGALSQSRAGEQLYGFMSQDAARAMAAARKRSNNRCGNRVVRSNLVEMVWRLMVWQPHYGPVRQLAAGLVRSKRAKRRLVVKAARRLAIDLWRLATEQTTAQKLGLIMHSDRGRN